MVWACRPSASYSSDERALNVWLLNVLPRLYGGSAISRSMNESGKCGSAGNKSWQIVRPSSCSASHRAAEAAKKMREYLHHPDQSFDPAARVLERSWVALLETAV